MSLVWTIIASFLYFEIGVTLLLTLPVFSPTKWQKFFKSRFLSVISRQAQIYFYLLFGILVIFLLEAIREMRKYSNHEHTGESSLNMEMQHSMRLFRAQRNFYISGFAIFLTLVIRRLVTLISTQATLVAQAEASMKQAQSATATARTLLAQKDGTGDAKKTEGKDEVDNLKKKVKDLETELSTEKKDKLALKAQSESLIKEYDRLTEEYSKLQNKIEKSDKSN
jgi:B-cell receptor-associated protein 31